MKKVQSVPAISYALSIFYATSFFIYWATLSIPEFRLFSIGAAMLFFILFLCSLGTAKLRETARKNIITFNIVLWVYSIFLIRFYPDLVQPSYIFMNLIVVLFFSQPSVRLQFLPGVSAVRKSVLVVDDDEGLLKTVQRILLTNGFSVLTASSGEKGLQIANLQKPDLILLDVILPGMKGREVCARLKDDPNTRDIPVIFLTAKDSPDDVQAERQAGAIAHLTKPVHAKTLLASVKDVFK